MYPGVVVCCSLCPSPCTLISEKDMAWKVINCGHMQLTHCFQYLTANSYPLCQLSILDLSPKIRTSISNYENSRYKPIEIQNIKHMKKLQRCNYPALIKLYHATLLPGAVQHSLSKGPMTSKA